MKKKIAVITTLVGLLGVWALADNNYTYIQGPALIQSFTTITTAGGTNTLDVTSNTNVQLVGSSNHIVKLPQGTTLQNGRNFTVFNKSSGVITVKDYGNTTLTTLQPNTQASFLLTSNSTSAGAWQMALGGQAASINGIATASQTLATGTTGTDFAISSASDTHTFNLPDASATARGVVTTGSQTIAGAKTLSSAPILSSLSASLPVKTGADKSLTASAISIASGSSEITGTLPIASGGTGATTAAAALSALGGAPAAGSTDIATLGTVTTGTWSAGTIAVNKGGTGATTAGAALTNLGAAPAAGSTDITTLGTVTTGTWSAGTVAVNKGGTGGTTGSITGSGALTFAAGGSNQNVTLTPSGTGNTILNGNVGIGISTLRNNFFNSSVSPQLQVEGTTQATSSLSIVRNPGYAYLVLGSSSGTTVGSVSAVGSADGLGIVDFQGADGSKLVPAARIVALSNGTVSTGVVPGVLTFNTASSVGTMTERMRVDSSGNFGIGTGASPQTRLSVETSGDQSTVSPMITAQTSGTTYGGLYTIRDGAGDQRGLIFKTYTANVGLDEKLRINSSGNVGIGTNNPAYKFVVSNSGATGLEIDPTGGFAGGVGIMAYDRTASAYKDIGFGTSFTQMVLQASTGNVGIGITSPNAVLHTKSGNETARFETSAATGSNYITFRNSSARMGYIGFGGTTNNNLDIYNDNSARIQLAIAGNTWLAVESNGDIVVPHVYSATVGATNRDLYVDNTGILGYVSSTRASKTNITDMGDVSWLYELNPVTFNYRKKNADGTYSSEAQPGIQYGMIAEEVEAINRDLVFYDETKDGKKLAGIQYSKLVPVLVKAVQELKAENDKLKARISEAGF